ncbi:MAG TPA: hypothetical protein PLH70_06420 [Bacteroidales bacterium]|nr:hypothetical protein [Bacteroidales bacterium]HPZ03851.1 hypothetical protein [Bacteroidales bacterium]HQB75416.1 hypothetical protein [Bacteroidales bacterium]
MIKKIWIPILLSLFIYSCEQDFSLNAPYRDVTFVYGVLDSQDSVHYLKIYKGVQTEGNPTQVVQDWTKLYYFDTISVTLTEFKEGQSTGRVITLDTTTSVPRLEGAFGYPTQLLYYTTERLDPTAVYHLKIVHRETGRIVEAETPILQPIVLNAPNIPENAGLNLVGRKGNIIFTHVPNAKAYEIFQYFHYFEVSKATGVVVREGYVKRDITNGVFLTESNVSYNQISREYNPSTLYDQIATQLKPDPTVVRYIRKNEPVVFEVWGASQSLYNYLLVNKPTSSIVQDRMEYTNLVAPADSNYATAWGVFASRARTARGYRINNPSEDSLVKGSKTSHLGFRYLREYIPM